jgi:hypothetical protein
MSIQGKRLFSNGDIVIGTNVPGADGFVMCNFGSFSMSTEVPNIRLVNGTIVAEQVPEPPRRVKKRPARAMDNDVADHEEKAQLNEEKAQLPKKRPAAATDNDEVEGVNKQRPPVMVRPAAAAEVDAEQPDEKEDAEQPDGEEDAEQPDGEEEEEQPDGEEEEEKPLDEAGLFRAVFEDDDEAKDGKAALYKLPDSTDLWVKIVAQKGRASLIKFLTGEQTVFQFSVGKDFSGLPHGWEVATQMAKDRCCVYVCVDCVCVECVCGVCVECVCGGVSE